MHCSSSDTKHRSRDSLSKSMADPIPESNPRSVWGAVIRAETQRPCKKLLTCRKTINSNVKDGNPVGPANHDEFEALLLEVAWWGC